MSDVNTEPATERERWQEGEAKFCDQMAAEYRGRLLDEENAIMQVRYLIAAETWEQMARHLRNPRLSRIEQEYYKNAL